MNPDLHLHTHFSHGLNSPREMYESAVAKGLTLIGFSEHSPRPAGYDYRHEYRERLSSLFPEYIAGVRALGALPDNKCEVLLGLEMDWLPAEVEFIQKASKAFQYDYLIGSVHFLDHWGFDDGSEKWEGLSREECEKLYREYFLNWKSMIQSGLFQIAAHPDLIKIYSVGQFRQWLERGDAQGLVEECLIALRDAGMAMEISSAGLRKKCGEIYPSPRIMELAARVGVRISLASDAHAAEDVAYAFPKLVDYAKSYGFSRQSVFRRNAVQELPL